MSDAILPGGAQDASPSNQLVGLAKWPNSAGSDACARTVCEPPTGTCKPLIFNATGFVDGFAAEKVDIHFNGLADLASLIQKTHARSKHDLLWIKLATFSGIPNPDSPSKYPSTRYDAGVVAITGVEGDYDSGKVSMDAAANLLHSAGMAALLYETPSSTEAEPRWRVLAPFSREYAGGRFTLALLGRDPGPEREARLYHLRAKLLARVNGVLGGILAGESFVLSQGYFFGSVADKPPVRVRVVDGSPIDLLHYLDALALYPNGSSQRTVPKERQNAPEGLIENDDSSVLLAEGWRRVQVHAAKHGIGVDPRGKRAHSLAAWLGDMRTTAGEVLSIRCIIELMQNAGYGDIAEDIIERRGHDRGCELVLSLAERLGALLGEAA